MSAQKKTGRQLESGQQEGLLQVSWQGMLGLADEAAGSNREGNIPGYVISLLLQTAQMCSLTALSNIKTLQGQNLGICCLLKGSPWAGGGGGITWNIGRTQCCAYRTDFLNTSMGVSQGPHSRPPLSAGGHVRGAAGGN